MRWVKNPNDYTSVEDAILRSSGQDELSLISPEHVDPRDIQNLYEATELIAVAAADATPILIVGDYDCDGITSTAILSRLCQFFGGDPATIIPKRFTDGYGVSERMLEGVTDQLIITVDNGIAAGELLDRAVTRDGNEVVVVDHHLPDERIPKLVNFVVDPHVDPEASAFEDYCGAGLAFKMVEAACIGEEPSTVRRIMDDCLVLAAIGTIADAVPLVGDNRRIVQQAIALIQSHQGDFSHGIRTLIELAGGEDNLTADSIGFGLAPLINAPGRLYNAGGTSALKMLMCDDAREAAVYGSKMKQINADRQAKVAYWMDAINKSLVSLPDGSEAPMVVYEPGLPEGLTGLVAGRLASSHHMPVIVLCGGEDGVAKGSARTYGDFHVKNMLDYLHDDMVTYGGHSGAAGLSVAVEQIQTLKAHCREYYAQADDAVPQGGEYIAYDVEITPDEVSEALEIVKKYQPLGHGVPNPVIRVNGLTLEDSPFFMGASKEHVKFSGPGFSAVAFSQAAEYNAQGRPTVLDLVGTLGENTFRGVTTPQIICTDFAAAGTR